ncbi:MAG: hypothetical protein HYT76_09535 [Deltaproteobacteria bacterium]|nr:hypothetical protein [Deltaproteobacteria bacterium]
MSMVHWFKGIFSASRPETLSGEAIKQGAEVSEKRGKPKLIDLTDGFYLVEAAKKWGAYFFRRNRDDFADFRQHVKTHRKVRKHIADFYDLPDIVDEVTEKILAASKEDERFKQLFS